ncbi:MAG: M23 family metallopeptidase [bacterium]
MIFWELQNIDIYISESAKQFCVSCALKAIRFLVRIKPHVLRFVGRAYGPFKKGGRLFIDFVALPAYRLMYLLRRHTNRVWKPAKNKLMFLVSNRFMAHVAIGAVALMVGILNLQTDEVRAETFGERSLMYSLVGQEGLELIEEYAAAEPAIDVAAVNYRESGAISSFARGIDDISYEDATAISIIGGGTIAAPTTAESAASIAARTDVETYTVQGGDTLSSIAEDFGISLNTLLWANDLGVRSILQPGDALAILPTSGVYHTVKSGDTLSAIANKYDVDADEILDYNKLASADDLVIGEKLIVPGGAVSVATASRSTAFSSVLSTGTSSGSTVGSGSMIWPTDLYTITQYYSWRHNGLDIDCGYTNDNYAADDGIVTQAGWLGGYGYLVEINHGNGIVTRYGHHSSLYVSVGQQVSQGQAIGRCGTTGRSTGTHLHLEVIVNGSNRNPLEYIR